MNTLYELDSKIAEVLDTGFEMSCIDAETGEIDETQLAIYLEQLQLDRKTKIDNIAVYVKNLEAEAVAIRAEEKRLKERREAKERKAERLKNYTSRHQCCCKAKPSLNLQECQWHCETAKQWWLTRANLNPCILSTKSFSPLIRRQSKQHLKQVSWLKGQCLKSARTCKSNRCIVSRHCVNKTNKESSQI